MTTWLEFPSIIGFNSTFFVKRGDGTEINFAVMGNSRRSFDSFDITATECGSKKWKCHRLLCVAAVVSFGVRFLSACSRRNFEIFSFKIFKIKWVCWTRQQPQMEITRNWKIICANEKWHENDLNLHFSSAFHEQMTVKAQICKLPQLKQVLVSPHFILLLALERTS